MNEITTDHGLSIILAFTSGLIFARFSSGFLFFLLFLIFFEICYAYYTRCQRPWYPQIRGMIIISSFLGFIIGRSAIKDSDPFRAIFTDDFDPEHKRNFLKRVKLRDESDSENDD